MLNKINIFSLYCRLMGLENPDILNIHEQVNFRGIRQERGILLCTAKNCEIEHSLCFDL